jgi:hypothetical protein
MDDTLNKIPYIRDLVGMFRTVDTAPTDAPKNLIDQIVIYKNATTYRLYWYDSTNAQWHYVTATA